MATDLRYDLDFLKRLLTQAIRLHRSASIEEATMLVDIWDYLMYLYLDALDDWELARTLVDHYRKLQAWLFHYSLDLGTQWDLRENVRFYIGFLSAQEQLLSLHHEIAKLPEGKKSRLDFMRKWKETARKLGL